MIRERGLPFTRSREQRLELPDTSFKQMERRLDRGRRSHIYPCIRQCLDRKLAAPAAEKVQVARGIAALQDLAGQGHGGRNSGGILVHIKCAVKMRYSQTFEFQ